MVTQYPYRQAYREHSRSTPFLAQQVLWQWMVGLQVKIRFRYTLHKGTLSYTCISSTKLATFSYDNVIVLLQWA